MDLENRIIASAIEQRNGDLFLKSLPRYVSLGAYFAQHRESLSKEDPLHPSLCAIPIVDRGDWQDRGCLSFVKDAVLGFAGNTIICDQREPFQEVVRALSSAESSEFGLVSFFACFDTTQKAGHGDWLDSVAAYMARVADKNRLISPNSLFSATCRFWNWLGTSQFRGIVESSLADVLVARWKTLLIDQRFALNRPMRTVPAIEAALNTSKVGLAKIGWIALAAEDAVDRRLSQQMRTLLQDSVGP
jgi:hypothetical protein